MYADVATKDPLVETCHYKRILINTPDISTAIPIVIIVSAAGDAGTTDC
jgi:hypothetical protein